MAQRIRASHDDEEGVLQPLISRSENPEGEDVSRKHVEARALATLYSFVAIFTRLVDYPYKLGDLDKLLEAPKLEAGEDFIARTLREITEYKKQYKLVKFLCAPLKKIAEYNNECFNIQYVIKHLNDAFFKSEMDILPELPSVGSFFTLTQQERLQFLLKLAGFQSEINEKFHELIYENCLPEYLRLENYGPSVNRKAFWFIIDFRGNFRLFEENFEMANRTQPSQPSSVLLAQNFQELQAFITKLKSEYAIYKKSLKGKASNGANSLCTICKSFTSESHPDDILQNCELCNFSTHELCFQQMVGVKSLSKKTASNSETSNGDDNENSIDDANTTLNSNSNKDDNHNEEDDDDEEELPHCLLCLHNSIIEDMEILTDWLSNRRKEALKEDAVDARERRQDRLKVEAIKARHQGLIDQYQREMQEFEDKRGKIDRNTLKMLKASLSALYESIESSSINLMNKRQQEYNQQNNVNHLPAVFNELEIEDTDDEINEILNNEELINNRALRNNNGETSSINSNGLDINDVYNSDDQTTSECYSDDENLSNNQDLSGSERTSNITNSSVSNIDSSKMNPLMSPKSAQKLTNSHAVNELIENFTTTLYYGPSQHDIDNFDAPGCSSITTEDTTEQQFSNNQPTDVTTNSLTAGEVKKKGRGRPRGSKTKFHHKKPPKNLLSNLNSPSSQATTSSVSSQLGVVKKGRGRRKKLVSANQDLPLRTKHRLKKRDGKLGASENGNLRDGTNIDSRSKSRHLKHSNHGTFSSSAYSSYARKAVRTFKYNPLAMYEEEYQHNENNSPLTRINKELYSINDDDDYNDLDLGSSLFFFNHFDESVEARFKNFTQSNNVDTKIEDNNDDICEDITTNNSVVDSEALKIDLGDVDVTRKDTNNPLNNDDVNNNRDGSDKIAKNKLITGIKNSSKRNINDIESFSNANCTDNENILNSIISDSNNQPTSKRAKTVDSNQQSEQIASDATSQIQCIDGDEDNCSIEDNASQVKTLPLKLTKSIPTLMTIDDDESDSEISENGIHSIVDSLFDTGAVELLINNEDENDECEKHIDDDHDGNKISSEEVAENPDLKGNNIIASDEQIGIEDNVYAKFSKLAPEFDLGDAMQTMV